MNVRAEVEDHAAGVVVWTFPMYVPNDRTTAGRLEDAGLRVRFAPKNGARTLADVRELMADAVAAVVSTDPFDRSVFEGARKLRVIARVGVGIDSIDVAAATDAGVVVTTTPGANHETVADHTLALMLSALRRTIELDRSVRRGEWRRDGTLTGWDLHGRVVGIIGYGSIGRSVARRLSGFGTTILVHEVDIPPTRPYDVRFVSLDVLLAKAEIVCIHLPLLESTRGLIGERQLHMMRSDAILINTSRGEIVDEAALTAALSDGRLRAAALDVFEIEPPLNSPLLALPNVTLSPHVGGFSADSVSRMLGLATGAVISVLQGSLPRGTVNPEALGGATVGE